MPTLSDHISTFRNGLFPNRKHLSGMVFIDVEVGLQDKKAHDFGTVKESGEELHSASKQDFARFIADAEFLCGHNIIQHDLKYLADIECIGEKKPIDTLFLSPLFAVTSCKGDSPRITDKKI